MNFDTLTRLAGAAGTRRDALRSTLALSLAGIGGADTAAKKKGKPKKRNQKPRGTLCQPNGQKCGKPGKKCNAKFCLNAPFTIEANWTVPGDHDTHLFVPAEDETTGPFPWIGTSCNPSSSDPCDREYPFACVDDDETSSGSEITTIYQRLEGTYEYWIEIETTTLAGDLTVVLRDSGGRIARQWKNPANPSAMQKGWHVFDIDGSNGSVTAIDELIDATLAAGAHDPNTNVCP